VLSKRKMAPIEAVSDLPTKIKDLIDKNRVMVFSKTTCPFCAKVKDLLKSLKVEYYAYELDLDSDGSKIQDALLEMSGQRTVPNVFIGGAHLGGCDDTLKAHSENRLLPMINPPTQFEYDLIVIGGGSGGLAAAKEAADLGKKVACCDFVKPSPQGTTWGLGGTCVNVGCIPKKLMHQAALLGHYYEDAKSFGWEVPDKVKHNWETMKDSIQDHIGSLNWNYRLQLRSKNVNYVNGYATFIDPHTIKTVNKKGKETTMTAERFLIATGGRPKYPNIPGIQEYCISSDDLFSLPYCPGKTLVIGASYVALECAGFLASLGLDVTVMVRSILLRGFDQDMSERIGQYMVNHGVKFIRPCVPTKVEKLEDGSPGRYKVTGKMQTPEGGEIEGEYNTVMAAVGRDPCTQGIGLDTLGINMDKSGFIIVDDAEQTNVSNVYAVGDILQGKPELTPVAIQAGRLLVRRLYSGSTLKCDYVNVPTTVFTPLEYGCIGLAEEDAIAQYGESDLEVYHTNFWPLEWTVAHREDNVCYAKLICVKSQNEKVVGFHYLGPNAGEVTQGFTLGLKLGATKEDFNNAIGIHPTVAEIFTTLDVTKSSGASVAAAGC